MNTATLAHRLSAARWFAANTLPTHLSTHLASQKRLDALWLLGLAGVSGLVGLMMMRSQPSLAIVAWMLYLAGAVAIFIQPRYGLYLTLFFTLTSDGLLIPWYPFIKNFSSRESIFFLQDSLIFSPHEVYLILIVLSMAVRRLMRRRLELRAGPLGLPMAAFTVAMAVGLVYGVVRGGSVNIGLWECRPMFYLPLMYFLAVNLLEERGHFDALVWAAMLGNLAQGLVGDYHFLVVMGGSLEGADRIMEHSSSIHLNVTFVLAITAWLYKASWSKRLLIPLMALPMALAYLANQRRASFVSLAIALVLIAIALYRHNRRLFWWIAPAAGIVGVLYLAAFWNSSSTLGMPARGLKSVIAPEGEDSESNIYRVIENINSDFTIHTSPLMGVGFGNKFYIISPMPDISFFDWWEYITHNSIIWVWMTAGLYGFLSMIIMVGSTLAIGTRAYDRLPCDETGGSQRTALSGDTKAIGLTLTSYIVMHFVYAYVDMSWDTQSMTFIGAAAGILGSMERVMARPVRPWQQFAANRRFAANRARYHWQKPRLPAVVLAEDEAPNNGLIARSRPGSELEEMG